MTTLSAAPALSRLDRSLRVLVAALLLVIVGAGVYWNSVYRAFEANLAAVTMAPFVGGAGSSGATFFLNQPNGLLGLEITGECTALILIAPLVVLAAVLLVFARVTWWRVFAGIAAMWLIITIVNEVRLAFIGWASSAWGTDVGYPISHVYVGSVIGILGFVAGLAALLITTGTVRRRRRH
jgi:exosortase/archaeosortase family protein